KNPFMQSLAILTQRVGEALVRAGAVAVKGDRESADSEFRHESTLCDCELQLAMDCLMHHARDPSNRLLTCPDALPDTIAIEVTLGDLADDENLYRKLSLRRGAL